MLREESKRLGQRMRRMLATYPRGSTNCSASSSGFRDVVSRCRIGFCFQMPRANLISLFADFATYSRDVAVVQRRGYRRGSWTYAQLMEAAATSAHLLSERGVRTGDRVILWAPNSFEWMAAFWGCLLRGAVAVPLDDGATNDFAQRVAGKTDAKLLVASRGKAGIVGGAADGNAICMEDLLVRGRFLSTADPEPRNIEKLADEPITRETVAEILFP